MLALLEKDYEEIRTMSETIKSQDDKLKSQDETIKSQHNKIADLRTVQLDFARLLLSQGMPATEVAAKTHLSLMEISEL